MGVQFDRILDAFTGPFEKIGPWDIPMPPGKVVATASAAGCVTSNRVNNSFIALNRLLKSNEEVLRLATPLTRERQDVSRRRAVRARQTVHAPRRSRRSPRSSA